MSPGPLVRDARPDDLDVIVGFNLRLALETESRSLDRDLVVRGVRSALADPDRLRYWVAVSRVENQVIGQAAISREWSDWRNGWFWWLQSVYVRPDARGLGAFRSLYAHIRSTARTVTDVIGLRLYVEHANESAQRAYRALGMRAGGYHVYEEVWAECEI